MNLIERQQAKSFIKQQELIKDPLERQQLEHMKDRAATEKRCMEILDSYGPNGYISPKPKETQPPKMTDEQLAMEEIMKYY